MKNKNELLINYYNPFNLEMIPRIKKESFMGKFYLIILIVTRIVYIRFIIQIKDTHISLFKKIITFIA